MEPKATLEKQSSSSFVAANGWRLHLKASEPFENIMEDINVKMFELERKRRQEEELLRARNEQIVTSNDEEKQALPIIDESDDETESTFTVESEQTTQTNVIKQTTKRAWAVIRRYIMEQVSKKKAKNSSMNWGVIKQTLNNMSNMDKAREELYMKYLNKGPSNCLDGLHVPEQILVRGLDGSVIGLVRHKIRHYFPISARR